MPAYSLEGAITLVVVVILDAIVLGIDLARRQGPIKLPDSTTDQFAKEEDPFEITTPLDWENGQAINEKLFWTNARLCKLGLTTCYLLSVCINAVAFGFSLSIGENLYTGIVFGLHTVLACYLFLISYLAISQTNIAVHWKTLIHLSVLSSLSVSLLVLSSVLPTEENQNSFNASTLDALWFTSLALHAIGMLIAINIPRGPSLHCDPVNLYSTKTLESITNQDHANVAGITGCSIWSYIMFSYTTKVVMLGNTTESLEIGDLPILPADMRATTLFARMRYVMHNVKLRGRWKPKVGSGWETVWRLAVLNKVVLLVEIALAAVSAMLFYAPAYFLQKLVKFMESEPDDIRWGLVYCFALFGVNAIMYLVTGQLWSISTTTVQSRLKVQLNSTLFAKCLVRKDVASSNSISTSPEVDKKLHGDRQDPDSTTTHEDFSSKAQIMTLMTTDVDRVSDFSWHLFSLVDSPIEVAIGSVFLYKLLGVSSLIGLAVTCLFLPINHYAGKVVVSVQENLMKTRDERVSLMNEVLGAIRMIKFMAWERSFESRIANLRARELKYQRQNYLIETAFSVIWNATPMIVTLVSFWHFAVFRKQKLTPSIAFTSITVFSEMKFALSALPETFINMLQGFVSLRRIETYLLGREIVKPPSLQEIRASPVVLNSATITWPQMKITGSTPSSVASTPRRKFVLVDLTLEFPEGCLSLISGKLGSGKTLLLLGLLGEADVLSGQVIAPRTPPDALASFSKTTISKENWVVSGISAYVPQSAWLQNASIRDNILFNLPYDEMRYQETLEACALNADLLILEDGDDSEIGERGVNLSGGQKARVSLARAVYSRASTLYLDDVLSAVDAHTAHHLYHKCLLGPLMKGRTVILVSHHVQLCASQAHYIVALDNGRVIFQGNYKEFTNSGAAARLIQKEDQVLPSNKQGGVTSGSQESTAVDDETRSIEQDVLNLQEDNLTSGSQITKALALKKPPRKLIEEEKRAVGRIGRDIWKTYMTACGRWAFWLIFPVILILASLNPVFLNGWVRIWSGSVDIASAPYSPAFYIAIYTLITFLGIFLEAMKWLTLYMGGIRASKILYARLLARVLRAQIRFHDTISRGRLLNRFGKDFEGIDSNLPDHFGRSLMYGLNVITTIVTITWVGGWPFLIAAVVIGSFYVNVAKAYSQISRDMRRLDSVTRSPLYSIYGETISGVVVIRSFGAGATFLREMLRCVDTNLTPYYWMWGVNRWLSVRFNLLSSVIIGVTGFVVLLTPGIDASLAGFALTFASNVTGDILFVVRRFVGLEQAMVAIERVKEFSEIATEPPEIIEPRPPAEWPEKGHVVCENLVVKYAMGLPNVLHNVSFEIHPGEKIGVLGRTGSGKSTLALSFFRFVEAAEGRIVIDGINIAQIGISDLRSRITIIPQDPTILSGSLRATLDVFDEYQDAEIFEALRRVHLISDEEERPSPDGEINLNIFRDLDSPVSEGGDNFSTGEKQLLCMARAILKRSKLLVMDEATASVDYFTDELIGKTIRQEFADSTILTIAHRLRTIIDYDRIMVLDDGKVAEFGSPQVLLEDSNSKFYSLCRATGPSEFSILRQLAGVV